MKLSLVVIGFLVHLIFFYSIFDIYFTSPIVHGMEPHQSDLPAPAKRVVLFVADGLRADRFYENGQNNLSIAPYLRTVINHRGAWGVSHTRVPTESRPGHVAIIAGLYEDVSAVSKGWKENPVEFDSLFNESRYTWSWGSPDILPMFVKGASRQHVSMDCYSPESEDFATAESSKLDTWVFDRVENFLTSARNNATLAEMINQDKVVFFLHLLGIDTVGHSRKPHSREYYDNIRVVDEGIKKMEQLIEAYFNNDGQTAYVMTADHGMTDWGSHGAGHHSETLTPLVVWGAGVRGPLPVSATGKRHTVNIDTDISVHRHDVNQADICPLMAALIGVPYPMNSEGILPVELLNTSKEFKAEAMFVNARQILAQFRIKMQQKQDTTLSALFVPFRPLTTNKQDDLMAAIEAFIHSQHYDMSIEKSRELITLSLQGLKYYHNYDRFFLGCSVVCGFCGWIAYIVSIVLRDHSSIAVNRDDDSSGGHVIAVRVIFLFLTATIICLLYVQSLPFTHYLYCLLPVALWYKVILRWRLFANVVVYLRRTGSVMYAVTVCVLALIGIEIMVLGIFWREVFSLAMLAIAAYPWLLSYKQNSLPLWTLTYCVLAVFPLLPVIGGQTYYALVMLAGVLAFVMGLYCLFAPSFSNVWQPCEFPAHFPERKYLVAQLCVILLAMYIVWSTSVNIADKLPASVVSQAVSWLVAGWSFIVPVLVGRNITVRLCAIVLGFLPTYFLLSIAQEGLFCVALCCAMSLWLRSEATQFSGRDIQDYEFNESSSIIGQTHRKLHISDLRLAFFFIFFLLFAFFGTGNIASINSFDPSSVYCFLTVFSPFVMGALMLWKILIPFLLVTCVFNAIHVVVELPMQSLFLLVLLMSDVMAMHFFFFVRDEGSWLDIGTSISHYVVVMALICFLFLLLVLSHVFTRFSLTSLTTVRSNALSAKKPLKTQ